MTDARDKRLIWIDLEMTGLDTGSDSILEIATLVTDSDLNELAQGPVYAIAHDEAVLAGMDDWNRSHHGDSGLVARVLASTTDMFAAQQGTLAFLQEWTDTGTSPMCGNSICQDRRFLHRLMPELEQWFHYRNLDVSTLKELASRWNPAILEGLSKRNMHLALEDIRDSVDELRHYRKFMGEFGKAAQLLPLD